MTADNTNDNRPTPDFLKTLWEKRAQGIPISESDLARLPTHEDITYLISRYPYVRLVNPRAEFTNEATLDFVFADTGWVIYDYENVVTTSPGSLLFNWSAMTSRERAELAKKGDEEGGGVATASPYDGKGTIVKQAFDTVMEMMALIKERDWPNVYLLEGSQDMAWAAWVAAEFYGYDLKGFEPTEEEEIRRKRLRRNVDLTALEKLKGPTPG